MVHARDPHRLIESGSVLLLRPRPRRRHHLFDRLNNSIRFVQLDIVVGARNDAVDSNCEKLVQIVVHLVPEIPSTLAWSAGMSVDRSPRVRTMKGVFTKVDESFPSGI